MSYHRKRIHEGMVGMLMVPDDSFPSWVPNWMVWHPDGPPRSRHRRRRRSHG